MGNIFSSIGNAVSGAVDGAVHDVEGAVDGVKNEFENAVSDLLDGGASTAPTPTINSQPPAPTQPRQWQAPSVASSGHITVRHGALTDAADVIKKYVPELDSAIKEVQSHTGSFDSLMSWSTGQSFGGNLIAAVTAFGTAGKDTSQAHADLANKAQTTAQTYADTESSNARTVSQINSGGGASGGGSGSASSSGGSSASAPVSTTQGSWS
jgi:hypothetical protein